MRESATFLQALAMVGFVICLFAQGPVAWGATGINQQINYQAKLMDSNGSIVPDGTYQMAFSLYDSSTLGATPFWTASGTVMSPTQIPVTVDNGLFTVMLGDTSSGGGWQNALTSIDWNTDVLYLGIAVSGDSEMQPRKRLGSVPQAFNAQQLQGMYASSTAASGATLFTVNQTSASAAADDRSALDVKTAGISDTKDFIARFYGLSGSIQASIRNDGLLSANRFVGIASTTGGLVEGINQGERSMGSAWGGAFNSLSVGGISPSSNTGTQNMVSVFKYDGTDQNAICLDDVMTASTCGFLAGSSLIADGTVNANAFDLAERYSLTGEAAPGDVLVVDPENPLFVKKSPGIAYDAHVVGIASTRPGFLLGSIDGVSVALSGRVPTNVSTLNGLIATGDALTSSPIPGVAMKATGPGRIVGYALQPAFATGTIEVFVKVGYDANSFLRTEGETVVAQKDLLFAARSQATPDVATVNSWGVTWRGSLWDGVQALNKDFSLLNQAISATTTALTLNMGTSTLWSVDETGSMRVARDLFLGGRFFPATRSGQQSDKYLFLDDAGPASSTYIATNADGWQANDSYDFAERYYSPDALEPGDIVYISQRGQFHVQRTMQANDMPIGIVSTRPAFVAGAPAPSTFPIALAGRVPTKVSILNGAIKIGDPLTASTLPGVSVKALKAGPIVGYALENYEEDAVGAIEVFVNAGWWGGSVPAASEVTQNDEGTVVVSAAPSATTKVYQGVARILAGATKVIVTHPSLGTFPLVQVTPYGKIDTQWWTDRLTDRGFEIMLREPLLYDATFSWRTEEMLASNDKLFVSNEHPGQWNIHSGEPIYADTSRVQTLPEVTSATNTEPTPTVPEPVVPETSTSTTDIPVTPTEEGAPTDPVIPTTTDEEPVTPVVSETTPDPVPPVTEPVSVAAPVESAPAEPAPPVVTSE